MNKKSWLFCYWLINNLSTKLYHHLYWTLSASIFCSGVENSLFDANLASWLRKIGALTASYNGAIRTKKNTIFNVQIVFFCANMDWAERHDSWPRLWLFFSPFLFPPKKKEGRRKDEWIAKIVIKVIPFCKFIAPFSRVSKH